MNWFLLIAAILSFVTFAVHLFVGGREMTATFGYAFFFPGNDALVVTMMIFSIGCALLSFGLILVYRVSPIQLPQWIFFALISVFAFTSLF